MGQISLTQVGDLSRLTWIGQRTANNVAPEAKVARHSFKIMAME
jgi:hypothetical protein